MGNNIKNLVAVLFLLFISYSKKTSAQQLVSKTNISGYLNINDSLNGFDEPAASAAAMASGCYGNEYKFFMHKEKRKFISKKYNIKPAQNIVPAPNTLTAVKFVPNNSGNYGSKLLASGACNNEDFEDAQANPGNQVGGAVNGWTVTGDLPTPASFGTASFCAPSATLATNLYTVYNAPVVDPYMIAPNDVVSSYFDATSTSQPAGKCFIRLNNEVTNSNTVKASKTYLLNPNNALFRYAYRAVLSDGTHPCCEQPGLTIKIKITNPATGTPTLLACPQVSVSAGPACSPAASGFIAGKTMNFSPTNFNPNWVPAAIDLSAYIGYQVTLDIYVVDCPWGGHAGYVYFDALCAPMTIVGNGTGFPAGTPSISIPACGLAGATLVASPGLGPYSWNSGQITLPAGAAIPAVSNSVLVSNQSGTVQLVMNPPGSCAPITKTINIIILPGPVVSVNEPTICLGSAGTVSASGSCVSYTWLPGSTIAHSATYAPKTESTYTVIGADIKGCLSSATTVIKVVATSPVTLTLPSNVCQGNNANLSAASNPPALAYSWTGPNTFTANGAATSISNIKPVSSGIYYSTGTWAMGSVSCSVTGFNFLSVVPINTINVNAPVSICYPGNVALTANSQGAISYTWTGPNTYSTTIANPLFASPMPNISGIYSITTAYTDGVLVCYNSNTTQVTVNPILPFTLDAFKQTCFNSNYAVAGPAGATTYTWMGPNGFTSNNQVLSIPAIQTNQAGDYHLTVNLGPCITSGSTKVEVISPIEFAQTPGNKTICKGDNIKLMLNSTGGSRNYAYDWNPAIYLTSATGSIQNCKAENTTVYNVTGYDISCPDYKVSTSLTVTVNKAPEPDLQLEKTQGCQPLCLKYNSKTQTDAALVTYDFGNGNIMQADNFSYCLNEAGTYNLKITTKGKNGCSETFAQQDPIIVWPTSHTELNWSPDMPSTLDNRVTFMPTSQYQPVKYEWAFQGTTGSSPSTFDKDSIETPLRMYDNAGEYPVMLVTTTEKGCKETIFKVLTIKDEFSVFIPNSFTPNGDGSNDIFNLKGVGMKTEGFVMSIYDRWGTLLYTTKDITKGWDGTVKGLLIENGIYVYKIRVTKANDHDKKEYVGHINLIK